MNKKNKQNIGDIGEKEIISLIKCPNCGKELMQLPKNYPLYDLQCSGCYFRAQVKTNNSKPKKEILGAGWSVMEKVLKAGYMIPPLIVNFKWKEKNVQHQKIIFYPFIPKNYIKKRTLSENARRSDYIMFNYINLDKLPHFVMYEK